jgi:membrane associated rhomboid family serine protease
MLDSSYRSDLHEFKRNVFLWIQGVPRMTRGLAGFMILVSCGRWILGEERFPVSLSLKAIVQPKLYVLWSWFTSGFYESSLFSLLVSLMLLCANGRFLERIWGSWRFLEFFMVTLSGSYLALTGVLGLIYLCSRGVSFYYGLKFHGMAPFFAAITIAYKQLLPENEFMIIPGMNFRLKFLPQITFVLLLVWFFVTGSPLFLMEAWTAMGLAWIYLRFLQKRESDVRGDRSEEFSLISFFPELFQ